MNNIIERLKVCWHVLTKKNYAFFAIGKDALVFDDNGHYSHIKPNSVTAYSDVDKTTSYITDNGLRTFYSFFWDTVKDFSDMRLKVENHQEKFIETLNNLKQMLDKFYNEQQHDENEKFYCKARGEVTYRKTCKNCIIASVDEDGNFYCPYYKK